MKKISAIRKPALSIILILALTVTLTPSYPLARQKVTLNKTKAVLTVGETIQLKLKNNKKKIKWSSSRKKVATVSKTGKVKAKKKGKAVITAKVNKKKYKCRITVKAKKDVTKQVTPTPYVTETPVSSASPAAPAVPAPADTPAATPVPPETMTPAPSSVVTPTPHVPLQSISLDKTETTIELGKSDYITIIPEPLNATDITEVVWESSDPELVKIEETDNPLKIKVWTGGGIAGTATVTAKIGDNIATCTVTVPDVVAELELSEDGTTVLGCTNSNIVTVIHIPDTVTTLGERSLIDCDNVKTLIIPSSVTTIEYYALPYRNLESVYIPPSVTYIDFQALGAFSPVIVYGESGSYAEEWANNQYNYTFSPVTEE